MIDLIELGFTVTEYTRGPIFPPARNSYCFANNSQRGRALDAACVRGHGGGRRPADCRGGGMTRLLLVLAQRGFGVQPIAAVKFL